MRVIRHLRVVGVIRSWKYLLKWMLIAIPSGAIVGAAVSLFKVAIDSANTYRADHRLILVPLLPLAGLIIVFIYKKAGFAHDNGTNDIVAAAHEGTTTIEWKKAPLVFAASVLTHITGGSSGCEGASLQIGGGILAPVSGFLKMGKNDSSVLMMTAIAAAFSALTGAPIASSVFAVEIAIVGSIQYSALLPCVVGAVTAYWTSQALGIASESYAIAGVPNGIDFGIMWRVLIIAVCCALVAILFCRTMEAAKWFYGRYFKNQYIRIVVGGLLVAGTVFLLQTDIYSGAGYDTIHRSFTDPNMPIYIPFIKLALTALTLGAGFRGGEILPTFFIGATMGSAVAALIGLETSFGAALGFTAVFCGVTNCPLAAFAMAAEIFNTMNTGSNVNPNNGLLFFAVAITVSYLLSGYVGLYPAQVYYQPKMHLRRYRKRDVKNAEQFEEE
jgi:H+/Cl- antiporter ClcA